MFLIDFCANKKPRRSGKPNVGVNISGSDLLLDKYRLFVFFFLFNFDDCFTVQCIFSCLNV